jgi:hypothetical protein
VLQARQVVSAWALQLFLAKKCTAPPVAFALQSVHAPHRPSAVAEQLVLSHWFAGHVSRQLAQWLSLV